MVAGKHRRTALVLSPKDDEFAWSERGALAASSGDWFANPKADEIRSMLDIYFEAFGEGAFGDPNPEHFMRFVRHQQAKKGFGSLTYVATRKVESIFEERMQNILANEAVKVECGDVHAYPYVHACMYAHARVRTHPQVERDDVLVDLASMSKQWASSPNVMLGASRKGLRNAVKDAETVSETVATQHTDTDTDTLNTCP